MSHTKSNTRKTRQRGNAADSALPRAAHEQQRQEQLLQAVNNAAAVLLAPVGEEDFTASLLEGMEIISRCADIDRVCLWRNETIDGVFCYVNQFHWRNDAIQWQNPPVAKRPYSDLPEWEKRFLRNEYINGPLSGRTLEEQNILGPQGVKSILAIPLYWHGYFYGFFSFDNCRKERAFTEDEVNILRSAGLMMVSAVNRHEQTANSRQRSRLLHAVNDAAAVMLAWTMEENFENALLQGMELMGRCLGVDRVQIWRNETADGALHFVHTYEWLSEIGKQKVSVPIGLKFPYSATPGWEEKFSRGEYINTPFSALAPGEQIFLRIYDIRSIVIIPLFLQDHFWGFFSIDDCQQERTFTEDEIDILRSTSLMMLSAMIRHEQAARIQEVHERAKLMLDATPLACNLWDRNYKCFDCNEESLKLFEMQSKQELLDNFFAFSPACQPDGRPSLEQAILHLQKAFAEGKDVFAWMHQTRDGTPLPSEVALVRVSYGNDYAVAGYMRDLREHKHIMDAIEQRDNLLHAVNRATAVLLATEHEEDFEASLLEGMDLMGRCVDIDRIHIWRNEMIDGALHCVRQYAWVKGTGRQSELVRARMQYPYSANPEWPDKFYRGEYVNGPRASLSRAEQDLLDFSDIRSVLIVPVHLQEHFWGFVSFGDCHQERTFTEDEVRILHSASLMMVSATKRYEQAAEIRQSHERARLLLDATPLVAQLWGRSGRMFDCNEKAFTVFRLDSKQEYMDRFYELSPEYQPNGRLSADLIAEYHARAIEEGRCVFEWMHQLPDGTPVPSEVTAVRVRHGDEYVIAGYMRDLREHTRMVAELEAALTEAQKANHAKSDFLANMSHEMRTPLNAIIGLSELAMEAGESAEEQSLKLEKIYNAGITLLSTVNDILDISKIEAGKFELVATEYDIPSLLNDAITQSVMHIGEKSIQFVLDIDENLPTRLYGDDLRSKQIFNNLLSNAFKYTKAGTVGFSVHCTREGDTVWMTASVRDTGIGIRPEDLDRLFSDFSQMDMASNRMITGTGLGLSISKRIAEMMGGSIAVESEYGKGSMFTVRLPQKFVTDAVIGPDVMHSLQNFRYSDQKRRQNAKMPRVRLPHARVLVVDDVLTNLDVARGMLKPYGMQIDCVTSGQQAVDAIRAENVRYNAVFMDHMMPGMDGMEAVRIIREEIGTEYARTVPIIALTANAIMGNDSMFLSRGFQAFLPKPVELDRLDAIVKQWIGDKEDADALQHDDEGQPAEMTPRIFPWRVEGADLQRGFARFGNDEEAFLQVLRSYAVNTRPLLETAGQVTRESLADYAVVVHGIRGSSRGICADGVGDRAEALEKAANAGDFDFVAANNAAFLDAAARLVDDLDALLRRMTSPKPKRKQPDRGVLDRLMTACETYDMDGVDAAVAELERYEYESDNGLAAWLKDNVAQMNLAQIQQRLAALEPDTEEEHGR
jgi:signal transduction histidine kinase/FixJ family two-component response regulator/transcriptional regulator with GAF, ATPase, and Fis domain